MTSIMNTEMLNMIISSMNTEMLNMIISSQDYIDPEKFKKTLEEQAEVREMQAKLLRKIIAKLD